MPDGNWFPIPLAILSGAWLFLLLNLVLHILLRELWISTIGLRYISGSIDFDALKFSPRFDRFLRKHVMDYDDYIELIEKLCSVVFAFTFLIIFMLISLGMFFLFVYFGSFLYREMLKPAVGPSPILTLVEVVMGLFLLSGLLYFIDFVSLGYLKRIKWLSRFYLPIYRFYSTLSLSFLYRPIYYNLIDQKFGRRLGFLLVPYVILVLLLFSLRAKTHPFFPEEAEHLTLKHQYYDDLREKDQLIQKASIPSKFVQNGFLELFVAYNPIMDDEVLKFICPDFEPPKTTGLNLKGIITVSNDGKRKLSADTSLVCLSQLQEVRIDDSLYQNLPYQFFEHPSHGEKGLLSVIDVKNLLRGKHLLRIDKRTPKRIAGRDSIQLNEFAFFPFWVE